MKEDNNIDINIPIYEILLIIGIFGIIIGIIMIAGIKHIEFGLIEFWIDTKLWYIFLPIGVGLVCGYTTYKILPDNKKAFWAGLIAGVIAVIIAVYIKMSSKSTYKNASDKYNDLQKLAELKQKGAITEKEFEEEKTKILK